jgi:hypothetical protein
VRSDTIEASCASRPWQVRSGFLTCNFLPLAQVGGACDGLDQTRVVNCVLKAGCAVGARMHIAGKLSVDLPHVDCRAHEPTRDRGALAPTIPTRTAFWVTVNSSTKLMSGPYSTVTCRAIRISFTQRFNSVNAGS